MAANPLTSVYGLDGEKKGTTARPAVFTAPIRPDLIHDVHTSMAKNKRQAYGVKVHFGPAGIVAGHQHSAHSWGTGRAVSRIPRVSGGGTHRAGQGAFGNMCRGGRMFAPTRTFRRWHRRINKNQRRYAVASALAATAQTPLVMARGHRVAEVPETPLVVDNGIESITKTKDAAALLKKLGAYGDVEKVWNTRKIRAGKGKRRNRRHKMRRGPLIIYANDEGIHQAFRNLPGVEICCVDRLNLLQLAPGSHLGRFCIWSQAAYDKLDSVFGTNDQASDAKKGYKLPRPLMTQTDLARILNSDEIQSKLRPANNDILRKRLKKNPLKNAGEMIKLNPYAATVRRREAANNARGEERRAKLAAARSN
eukprot:GABV01000523.1.p1 GENE.GABV01000523.1~~GABV01000523.1.p1  ORF type:complete len:365 (+),score=137.36 GABV01000523.1:17-1111(+)